MKADRTRITQSFIFSGELTHNATDSPWVDDMDLIVLPGRMVAVGHIADAVDYKCGYASGDHANVG